MVRLNVVILSAAFALSACGGPPGDESEAADEPTAAQGMPAEEATPAMSDDMDHGMSDDMTPGMSDDMDHGMDHDEAGEAATGDEGDAHGGGDESGAGGDGSEAG